MQRCTLDLSDVQQSEMYTASRCPEADLILVGIMELSQLGPMLMQLDVSAGVEQGVVQIQHQQKLLPGFDPAEVFLSASQHG